MKKCIMLGLGTLVLLAGCRQVDSNLQYVTQTLTPTITKAIAETKIETSQLQGGVQGIEPGYGVDFEGYWVTGIKGQVVVYLKGVAGQVQGAGQATATQPAK